MREFRTNEDEVDADRSVPRPASGLVPAPRRRSGSRPSTSSSTTP